MASQEIEILRRALGKRGFRKDDVYFHECSKCGEGAVEKYVVQTNRTGGRDIDLCVVCGHSRSWTRAGQGNEERVEDQGFDLKVFLRL